MISFACPLSWTGELRLNAVTYKITYIKCSNYTHSQLNVANRYFTVCLSVFDSKGVVLKFLINSSDGSIVITQHFRQ